ncbi:MAG: cytochrome c [Alphaproteobacteria bacterium]|nr:cytochrome c [Alphaproteobacteria bacterium]
MRQISFAALLAAGAILLAAAVDPHVAIPARQMGMKQVGRTFKGINDQLHAAAPDAKALKEGTEQLDKLAKQVPGWFPAGSGPDSGVKTSAKASIWTEPADFHAKAVALAAATHALAEGAKHSGDPAVLTPLVRQVGGACKACHTTYKTQDS